MTTNYERATAIMQKLEARDSLPTEDIPELLAALVYAVLSVADECAA